MEVAIMTAPHAYEFGPYRLNVATHRLLRDTEPVSLTPKAFDILLALIERRERVVDKAELMRLVWSDSFVEEANLSQTVFVLRKRLAKVQTDVNSSRRFPGGARRPAETLMAMMTLSLDARSRSLPRRGVLTAHCTGAAPHSRRAEAQSAGLLGGEAQTPVAGSCVPARSGLKRWRFSFADAIERGLRWNLGVLLSRETIRGADGQHQQAFSSLLPHLALTTSLNVQQLNVRAQEGIGFPGLPSVIGPFANVDARVRLTQSVFDRPGLLRVRAEGEEAHAARQSHQDVREAGRQTVAVSEVLQILRTSVSSWSWRALIHGE